MKKSSVKFYAGEFGYNISVVTGISLESRTEGDVKAIFSRPDGTVKAQNIPLSDWSQLSTGTVNVLIETDTFTATGPYRLQVVVNIGSGRKPSHIVEFDVIRPLTDLSEVFV